jgi:hypothetical protein
VQIMLVFDFFAGTGSSTRAFEDAGDTVVSFDNDARFDVTENVDVASLFADDLVRRYGRPDFVWASPPCTAFSVASIGRHWVSSRVPRTNQAREAMVLVRKTRELLESLSPRFGFVIENPRGMLRKLDVLAGLPRHTVTYCQYGDDRMKPTDLWSTVEGWFPRLPCRNGGGCHVSAPRGSRTGTQGRDGAVSRSMVPFDLGAEIRSVIVGKNVANNVALLW